MPAPSERRVAMLLLPLRTEPASSPESSTTLLLIAGKTYLLFGPVGLTHPEIAEIIGRVLGRRPIHWSNCPREG